MNMLNSYNVQGEKGVSVVICCYNSAGRIQKTLNYLAVQRVPDEVKWEVVLVNNASVDNTVQAANDSWAASGSKATLRVVEEPKPGLSYARAKGFQTAAYEYIIMCDDDNWLREDYIASVYEIMEGNGWIGALNGVSEAASDVLLPAWFPPLQAAYAVGSQHIYDKGEVEVVWGAGMVLRKSIWLTLREAGFESLLADRKGKSLSSGGDDELCAVIKILGYKIWYDSKLHLKHFIPKERLTKPYIRKLIRATAFSAIGLEPYKCILKNEVVAEEQINRRLWMRKSYESVTKIVGEVLRFKPFKAWRQKDLTYLLLFEKDILVVLIFLSHIKLLSENMRKTLLLSNRLQKKKLIYNETTAYEPGSLR